MFGMADLCFREGRNASTTVTRTPALHVRWVLSSCVTMSCGSEGMKAAPRCRVNAGLDGREGHGAQQARLLDH